MNTDRFLTRVFDTQEKKMHYIGLPWSWDPPIIAEMNKDDDPNRFVPMQCTGLTDKKGKLIYEDDIITNCCIEKYPTENYLKHLVTIDEENCLTLREYWASESIILGNRWENEKLLEVKHV